MDDPAQADDEPIWFSPGTLTRWVWEHSFTRTGAIIFAICSTTLGAYWYYDPEQLWMLFLSPLAILVVAFVLLLAALVAVFGDLFADWLIEKLLKKPDATNPLHQALYLLLSSVGFILAAIVLGTGDADVRGYWHH